jgi:dTDP-4-dehydrorhamnose reductase
LRLGKQKDAIDVIYDQVGTPTYAGDLALAIMDVIAGDARQNAQSQVAMKSKEKNVSIYHYSNEGVCSWYDFSRAIFELVNIPCRVKPIETKDYPTPAKRPHYSVLNKSKIKNITGKDIPYWKDSLKVCLGRIQY